MQLVETIQLKKTDILSKLCHQCKNLYNLGNYYIIQYAIFIRKGEYLNQLDEDIKSDFLEMFKRKREIYYKKEKKKMLRCPKFLNWYDLKWILKTKESYKKLPSQVAQNTLKYLSLMWKGFFNSLKVWKKSPEKDEGRPNPPRYLKKDGEYVACFNHQHTKIRNGKIRFPKKTKLEPIKVVTTQDISQQIRIVPKFDIYNLEMIYNHIEPYDLGLDSNRMIGIDIGVNNLACVVNNIGLQPFTINGKPLKSINHFFNKEIGKLQKKKSKQLINECKQVHQGKIYKMDNTLTKNFINFVEKQSWYKLQQTKKMRKLRRIRHNKIKDYMHKSSRYIIDYCIENNIGTIVIGKNPLWKTKINIGKRNNQNFVQIPFNMLIEKLQYKVDLIGIQLKTITEEYTSKCSFLDNESIEFHEQYEGKRISRGLFKALDGRLINADVNGAYNILKKAFPKAINVDGIQGAQLHPLRVNVDTKSMLIGIKTS